MLEFNASGGLGGPLLLLLCSDAVTVASTLVSTFTSLAVIPNARTLLSAKKCSTVSSASFSHRPSAHAAVGEILKRLFKSLPMRETCWARGPLKPGVGVALGGHHGLRLVSAEA